MSTAVNKDKNYLLKLLMGPAIFAVIYFLPMEGLEFNAKICLAMYAWIIMWLAVKPIPWIPTIFLPMVIFPVLGIMPLTTLVSTMLGQRMMLFLMFIFLLGSAAVRVGIGKRIAMNLLSLAWVDGKIKRFVIVYMIVTAVLEALLGPAGAAIAVPIGVSVIEYIYSEFDKMNIKINKTKFSSYVILAAAYASIAGGLATMQGMPQNLVVISLYEELTGTDVTYIQWLIPGTISAILSGILVYFVLHRIYKFDVTEIPGGIEYFKKQKELQGKITTSEVRLTFIILVVLVLWVLTAFITIPGLEFYSIAILGMILMFIIPEKKGETTGFVTVAHVKNLNWDILIMVSGAIGFSGMLTEFGIIDWFAQNLNGMGGITLLIIATALSVVMTNLLAGIPSAVALSTLLLPLMLTTGIHPLVVVKIISIMTVGLIVPWAGSGAAIFFGSQHLDMKEMFRTGVIMAIVLGAFLIVFNLAIMGIPMFYPPLP